MLPLKVFCEYGRKSASRNHFSEVLGEHERHSFAFEAEFFLKVS